MKIIKHKFLLGKLYKTTTTDYVSVRKIFYNNKWMNVWENSKYLSNAPLLYLGKTKQTIVDYFENIYNFNSNNICVIKNDYNHFLWRGEEILLPGAVNFYVYENK